MDEAYPKAYQNMDDEPRENPTTIRLVAGLDLYTWKDHGRALLRSKSVKWISGSFVISNAVLAFIRGNGFNLKDIQTWLSWFSLDWTLGILVITLAALVVAIFHETKTIVRKKMEGHKEMLSAIQVAVSRLADVQSELESVRLLLPQLQNMERELQDLLAKVGPLAFPIGQYLDDLVSKGQMDNWDRSKILQYRFKGRYELLLDLVGAAHVVVRDPVPPHDGCVLFAYPAEVCFQQLLDRTQQYTRLLRAHAASLAEESVKLTSSAIDHT